MKLEEYNNAQNHLRILIESWEKRNIDLALELMSTDAKLQAFICSRYLPFLKLFGLKYLNQLVEIPNLLYKFRFSRGIEYNPTQLNIIESIPINRLMLSSQQQLREISAIFRLKKLKELTFVNLPLWKQLASNINNLEQLEELYIIRTGLTKLPESIGQLKKLRKLHLKQNQINSLPNGFGQLNQLEELIISQHQTISIPASIGHLKKLEHLSIYIWGNGQILFPDLACTLLAITTFHLRCPQLKEIPLFVYSLKNLKRLVVSRSQLTKVPSWLGQLSQLESLDLSHNPLPSLPPSLQELKHLTELNVTRTKMNKSSDIILQDKQQIHYFLQKHSSPDIG